MVGEKMWLACGHMTPFMLQSVIDFVIWQINSKTPFIGYQADRIKKIKMLQIS